MLNCNVQTINTIQLIGNGYMTFRTCSRNSENLVPVSEPAWVFFSQAVGKVNTFVSFTLFILQFTWQILRGDE